MTSKLSINLADLLRQRTVKGDRIEYKEGWKIIVQGVSVKPDVKTIEVPGA
jgi:hypothetical protein